MNSFELQIQQGAITTNLETLKKELSEIAAKYEGVIVSEESVPIAKKDLAELRKIVREIEDRRKSVKKEWNKPYTDFEAEVKAALEIINKPIGLIDSQIKEFEAQRKAEKEQRVREIYAEQIQGFEDFLPFTEIFDERWLNVSTKDSDIVFDINGKVTQVKMDLNAIDALNSEFKDEVVKAYKESGNQLSAAIKRNTDLISAKQAAEKRAEAEAQAKIDAERRAREEAEKKAAEAEKALEEIKEEPKEEPIETLPFDEDQPTHATFTVWGVDNLLKVRLFLMDNDIKYEETY